MDCYDRVSYRDDNAERLKLFCQDGCFYKWFWCLISEFSFNFMTVMQCLSFTLSLVVNI